MQMNVEHLGALERRLNVSIPQEKIETEVESRLKRWRVRLNCMGFGPARCLSRSSCSNTARRCARK